jgi:hypothetical protein
VTIPAAQCHITLVSSASESGVGPSSALVNTVAEKSGMLVLVCLPERHRGHASDSAVWRTSEFDCQDALGYAAP